MRIYPWPVILMVPLMLGSMIVIGHERGATQEAGRHPVASLTPPSEPSSAQGNPLWGIPLSSLTATRNRPIFTQTRRPPPDRSANQPRPSSGSQRPPFLLVGAIAADNDSIAILIDENAKTVVRLRQGESHLGWTLQSVKPREITLLRSDRQTAVLALGGK